MILDSSQKPQFREAAGKLDVLFLSISDLLAKGTVFPQQIDQFIPIEDQQGVIAGYHVVFKNSSTQFFRP